MRTTVTPDDDLVRKAQEFTGIVLFCKLVAVLHRKDRAGSVARKHPGIKHASSITRNPDRSDLLARYQERQNQFREWQQRMPKRSRDQLAAQLAQKDVRIAELEHRIEVLRISHLAMIRAVGELGGISKWLKLYADFREVRNELSKLSVMPQADVKQFPLSS